MRVEGDDAKRFKVICLWSMKDVNNGELLVADEDNGFVRWNDKTGEEKTVTLGQHAIRIVTKK